MRAAARLTSPPHRRMSRFPGCSLTVSGALARHGPARPVSPALVPAAQFRRDIEPVAANDARRGTGQTAWSEEGASACPRQPVTEICAGCACCAQGEFLNYS